MEVKFDLKGKLWKYEGKAAWFFFTIDTDTSNEIKTLNDVFAGFGSVKVEVTIGSSVWLTSLFPNKKTGEYFLPIKAAVRKQEDLNEGDMVDYSVKLMNPVIV